MNSQSKPIRPPYRRDDSSKTAKVDPADYARKFSAFLEMVTTQATGESSAIDGVLIVHPSVLGDTYAEMLQSLSSLAEAGLTLGITDAQPGSYRLDRLNRIKSGVSTQARSAKDKRKAG